ncbi:MAG TPA: EAL domain-containing protein [Thermoleophilaceae bacterium]|nr:EAL domain-containing protein [Thermoleophilaceae bacterium]
MIPESEIRVRRESVRVGQMLSFVVCAGAQIYVIATWDQPHRLFLTGVFIFGVLIAALISLLPIDRIVRGPRREWFFLGWSALDYALVTAIAIADGGPRSPFVFLFVLPTIFAALSYPLWSTLATSLLGCVCFVLVAVTSNDANLEYDSFVIFSLLCAGALCSWQARNAGRARGDLSQTVAALSLTEERSRLILETAHDAYVAMDEQGAIIDWNKRAEQLFGWSREEAFGLTVGETIVPPHFRELHLRGLRHYVETGEGPVLRKRIELSALHRDGHEFAVELSISPVRYSSGVTFHAFLHDISERKESEAALRRGEMELRRSRRRLEQAQGIAHMGSWEWDVRANKVNWSDELYRIYGLEPGEFGATFEGYLERVHAEDRERVQATIGRALADHRPFFFEERVLRPNGHVRLLESQGEVQTDADGQVVRMIGVCHDVTERRAAEVAAREAEERFRSAFEHGPVGIALVDVSDGRRGRYIEVNRAICEIAGYSEEELLTTSRQALTHPEDAEAEQGLLDQLIAGKIPSYSVENRTMRPDGEWIWTSVNTSLVRDEDGGPLYAIIQVQDVSERKRFEGQLQYLADHDPLTGLFNRRRFESELSRQVAFNSRYGPTGAVLVVDLDHFKYVNDTLGHAIGDEMIARVGTLLRERLRETDVVARLGGDEFAVLLPSADEEQARLVGEDIVRAVRTQTIQLSSERQLRLTACVGIALFGQEYDVGHEAALVNADIAMYEAKEAGRDRCVLLDATDGPQTQMRARLTWSQRIRTALEEDRFELYQQPILDIRRGEVTHHELLVRLPGDSGELIPPGTFLYIAEQFGLIQAIDRWVIGQATRLIKRLHAEGEPVSLSVNLSGASITDASLLEFVEQEIQETGIDPHSLIFEVTETAAIVNIDKARRFAERLGELGCAFALDDFGAGFGSFYYLKHLPFDYLKIDGDFIRQLPVSKPDQLTVKAIVQIAHGLGKRTVAEFVGDDATLALLGRFGVDYAQGYHTGRPAAVEDTWPPAASEHVRSAPLE